MAEKDFLWLHMRDLPYFRALVRSVEARFYGSIHLPQPVLDLGCGDGHFASLVFEQPMEVGLDPWWSPIKEAAGRGAYQLLVQADGGVLPFPNDNFASAVSNSVLEHIQHVDLVLLELSRVIQPGGLFVFCVPNQNFLAALSIGQFLDAIGFKAIGNHYRHFFNHISRHYHCETPEVWSERLENAGFAIEKCWHYFSPQALKIVEWGHYFGLPSLICRWLSGKWILMPTRWNLAPIRRILQPYYDQEPVCDDGVYTFYMARRK